MLLRRQRFSICLVALLWSALSGSVCKGQAALLLEQPYGFFGTLNPTGHAAIYLARVCADTPVKVRVCHANEEGVVISRYGDIDHYDWIAIPLVAYLYSVEDVQDVPKVVNHEEVMALRNRYREQHLLSLGDKLQSGNFFKGGWTELVGASYERKIYAYRFNTTEAEDAELIAKLNEDKNRSHFNLFFQNCSDFARRILSNYMPGEFKRSIFPDAGVTTPKQVTYKLVSYANAHPELDLEVFEIPQVPGFRRHSYANHGVAESLITTGYAVPIVVLNPYLAGGLFVDYLVRGRTNLVPKEPQIADAEHLDVLTGRGEKIDTAIAVDEEREREPQHAPPAQTAEKASQ